MYILINFVNTKFVIQFEALVEKATITYSMNSKLMLKLLCRKFSFSSFWVGIKLLFQGNLLKLPWVLFELPHWLDHTK